MRKKPYHIMRVAMALCLICPSMLFAESAWDLTIPLPSNDPVWEDVKKIWDDHWDGKNIDQLIDTLYRIEETHGDAVETHLWLSRACYLKARYHKKNRADYLKKSESHAVKALSIDPHSIAGMKLLITSVSSYADLDYIKKTYGPFFMDKLPVPIGRALPEMDLPEFGAALKQWDQRDKIEKGEEAVALFKKIADENPKNALAQTWVARGNYYLGYYYISLGQDKRALPFFIEGDRYGQKAIALAPNEVPANYWRQLNLARSIQNANILVKAGHMKPIMDHLVLTANENMTYFYCGPLISTATIIEKGGWVAEKGLGLAGYTMETVKAGLELAVLAFPTYFYTHFARAEVFYHLGKKEEAKSILTRMIAMDPYQNQWHAAENLCAQRLAKTFLEEHFRSSLKE